MSVYPAVGHAREEAEDLNPRTAESAAHMGRAAYIRRLAMLVACGGDDSTATDEEYTEAVAFLGQIGIAVPNEDVATDVVSAGA